MDAPSFRRFRPCVERLDQILSTSTLLPSQGLIDLRSTQITTDLRNDLLRSTPHDGRQGWSLNLIKGSPSTRMIYGSVTLLYRAKPFGIFSSTFASRVKLKVDIAFATNLDAPKPGNVLVTVSRDIAGFGQNVRDTMALGIIAFLKQDHSLISTELNTPPANPSVPAAS
jgi:hypothetical protein